MNLIWLAPILVVVLGTVMVTAAAVRVGDAVTSLRASLVRLDDVRRPIDDLRADVATVRAALGDMRRR